MDPFAQRLIAIALGGAVGAVNRYLVVLGCERALGERFPYGVLVANVAGCFLLGLLMHQAILGSRWLTDSGHVALTIGFLGALTTFSTFGYDTFRLYLDDKPLLAIGNVLANCVLGFTACWMGKLAGDLMAQRPI